MTKTFNSQEAIALIYKAKICRRKTNLAYLMEYMCETIGMRYQAKVYYYRVTPGKWTRIEDYEKQFTAAAELLGLIIEFGNDAPRGGKTGNYAIITIPG
jgi:hypothetical protein